MIEKAETVKRKYTLRTPEEIAADKAAKEERRLAREKAKAEKEANNPANKQKLIQPKDSTNDVPESPSTHKPAERTAAKKSNNQKVVVPKKGQWSDPINSLEKHRMFVELELLESALGTAPGSTDIFSDWVAQKAPDAASMMEEIVAIGEAGVVEKGTTIFPRGYFNINKTGDRYIDIHDKVDSVRYKDEINHDTAVKLPHYWNYQIRGFFKDSCGFLSRANYGESAALKAFKKVIDGNIQIFPRRIAIDFPETFYNETTGEIETSNPGELVILTRPILFSNAQGTQTAIARSEIIPAGSRIKFCIEYLDPKLKPVLIEWLNYGSMHGLGAWRNSGHGTFRWREINEDFSIIEEDEE